MTGQADTLGNFALASAQARDWLQAISRSKEALQVGGSCKWLGNIHKNLGLIYCRSGDLKNGEEQLHLALKIKPNDPDLLTALQVIASPRSKIVWLHDELTLRLQREDPACRPDTASIS